MIRLRPLLIFAAFTVVLVAAAILSRPDDAALRIAGAGELVFPSLLGHADAVAEVRAISAGEPFTVVLGESGWTLREKSDYPVALDKIHQLVVGAAGLRRIEPKTADANRYAKIGLEDPQDESAHSIRFTLLDAKASTLADFILGNRQASRIDLDLTELYLREPGVAQSWLVEGKLPRSKLAIDWLDREILELDWERVHRMQVSPLDASPVVVRREAPSLDDFELLSVPTDRRIREQWQVNDIGRGLTELRLEDVRRIVDSEVESPAFTLELTTFDGLQVRVIAYRTGEKTFARFSPAFDPSSVDPRYAPAEEGAQDPDTLHEDLHPAAAVRLEVERLRARWEGWEYELPKFKVGYFERSIEDLTSPAEES